MTIDNSQKAYDFLIKRMRHDIEEVWIVALNSHLKIVGADLLFRGTLDHCPIHPRDIFRYLLKHNAYGFILAHSHPSGDPMPSLQDKKITERILFLSLFHELYFLDHLVVCTDKFISFEDLGLMKRYKKRSSTWFQNFHL